MMIKSIAIHAMAENTAENHLSGSVVLSLWHLETGGETRAQFICRVDAPKGQTRDQHLIALARDALRQARRLPDCATLVETEAFAPQNITVVP